jgi:two-component system response regulator AtoC
MAGRVVVLTEDDASFEQLAPMMVKWQLVNTTYHCAADLYEALQQPDFDAALFMVAPPFSDMGIEFCQRVLAERPGAHVILVLEHERFDTAVAALRVGAFDVLVQPARPEEFEDALRRATRMRTLTEKVERLRRALAESTGFEELIGVSQPMQNLYELLARAAETNASVLITGESGTGKELVARALHTRSVRSEGPFVAVNCSAIPDTLFESELFGHVRGAFTDAKVSRAGLFSQANGGTVFLDEIGDMPVAVQPKLLRALQERKVRPVGGDTEVAIDVRVIAATNRNLEIAVAERTFREDLFYRINVIHIDIPPLRERASDVLLLAQHFIEHYALHTGKSVRGMSAAAADKLTAYSWPGNIRELQNCIERAVSLTRHYELETEDLPAKIERYQPSHVLVVAHAPADLVTMDEIERRYISRVLQSVDGNKREAARILGFDRKTLYRKLERYGIDGQRTNSPG